jgi:hypothetical protein
MRPKSSLRRPSPLLSPRRPVLPAGVHGTLAHMTVGAVVVVVITGAVAATTVVVAGMAVTVVVIVVAMATPTPRVPVHDVGALVLLQPLHPGGPCMAQFFTQWRWPPRACSLIVLVSVPHLLRSVAYAYSTTADVRPVGSIGSHRRLEQLGTAVPSWLDHRFWLHLPHVFRKWYYPSPSPSSLPGVRHYR